MFAAHKDAGVGFAKTYRAEQLPDRRSDAPKASNPQRERARLADAAGALTRAAAAARSRIGELVRRHHHGVASP